MVSAVATAIRRAAPLIRNNAARMLKKPLIGATFGLGDFSIASVVLEQARAAEAAK